MTHRLYIDFETRSTADLGAVGSWNYAKHPTTDILQLAYAIDDGPVKLLPHDGPTIGRHDGARDFEHAIWQCYEIWAHNVAFERHIYSHVLCARYGWPQIDDSRWRCSMALCDRWGLPGGLEDAARTLRLTHQKDKIGRALMLKMCRPRRSKAATELKWFEDSEDLKRLGEYCKKDVEVERAIATKLPPLEPEELAIWQWTEKLNDYGILTDQELVHSILKVIAELDARDLAEFRKLTKGTVESPRQVAALKEWLADSAGLEIDNLQAATIRDVLQLDEMSDRARQALEARKNLSKSSLAKFTALRDKADPDTGRVHGYLRYARDITRRWASYGIQLQNLPAETNHSKREIEQAVSIFKTGDLATCETLLTNVREIASLSTRSAFCASKDKVLVAVDFAAIELRGLLWAVDAPQLEAVRQGKSLYLEMASKLYQRPIDKTEDPLEYGVGKRAVLSLGYGAGWKKFQQKCHEKGIEISDELSKNTVDLYRGWITTVPEYWTQLENAFMAAMRTGYCDDLPKNMRVEYKQNTLRFYLPCGQCIVYWYPKILDRETPWGEVKPQIHYYRECKWDHLYGGKLAGHATQSHCRDLLRNAALRVDQQLPEYKPVLTVHDELVYEVKSADLDKVVEILCEVPDWAAGMPIAAEGWIGPRYKK